MSGEKPFTIPVGGLRRRDKDSSTQAISRIDEAGEKHGFVDREPKRRGGRQPSPRTGQIHAKVLPDVADEIAAESQRTGKTQGVIIEEAWEFYRREVMAR